MRASFQKILNKLNIRLFIANMFIFMWCDVTMHCEGGISHHSYGKITCSALFAEIILVCKQSYCFRFFYQRIFMNDICTWTHVQKFWNKMHISLRHKWIWLIKQYYEMSMSSEMSLVKPNNKVQACMQYLNRRRYMFLIPKFPH